MHGAGLAAQRRFFDLALPLGLPPFCGLPLALTALALPCRLGL